jgi:hypothetical protein
MPRVASSPDESAQPGQEHPHSVTTATKSVSAAGEQRDKPLKPLRAERWEAGVSVVTNSYALFQKLHARLRVHWAPGVPYALFSKRGDVHWQTSDALRRENAEARLFEI